ncbi:RNA polymerase sigma-70 factor [Maribellus sp. YY47]|uniref:RNA polymerase sigma-70 factor n=1 Tax=Maribellus sp. YY47 TaxID=2929486 RepID=UPI0020007DEE|nr:RNA polymerase sigma-70 factor [Maribellus sp. YY47]MCK3685730.1 RNA polymerase sigma-70 factor [Maribellus sp. YY47]
MIQDKELNTELLNLIKRGDEKAFRIVFNSYFPRLLAFSSEYVNDREVAKNLVQESFLTLWERHETLNPDSDLKAYLFQVLRNKSLNYLKTIKVKQKYEEHLKYRYNELLLNYEALSHLDFDVLSFNELKAIIENTIAELPPQCKRVFELSRYEMLKNKEIADQLGISVKAVEGQMSKALKLLKKRLKEHFPSEIFTLLLTII